MALPPVAQAIYIHVDDGIAAAVDETVKKAEEKSHELMAAMAAAWQEQGCLVPVQSKVKEGDTVRTALQAAGVLPSMVIVSHDGTVLPHSTPLNQPVQLLVTTISSGG